MSSETKRLLSGLSSLSSGEFRLRIGPADTEAGGVEDMRDRREPDSVRVSAIAIKKCKWLKQVLGGLVRKP